jgi:hypothetical protein
MFACDNARIYYLFLYRFIYNPFFVLFRAIATFCSLGFSGFKGVLGSVQLYCIHYRYAIFLSCLKAGWLLKVNGLFYVFLGLKSFRYVKVGANVFVLFVCFIEGAIAELRYSYGILLYYYHGVSA